VDIPRHLTIAQRSLDVSMIRVFSHYISIRIVLLMLIEGVLLLAASFAGVAVRFFPASVSADALFTQEAVLFAFFMIVVMAAVIAIIIIAMLSAMLSIYDIPI